METQEIHENTKDKGDIEVPEFDVCKADIKKKNGRPSKYKPEYAKHAYKLCILGFTDEELAEFFEVERSTISRWKLKEDDFAEALCEGKIIADTRVAESLYRRATGYEYEEVQTYSVGDDDGKIIKREQKTKKHMPPDTGACMAWLKNRQPRIWRDSKDVQLNVKGKLEDFISE